MSLTELTPERAAYLEGCAVTEMRMRQELVDALDLHGGTDWPVALAYATRAAERMRVTDAKKEHKSTP